MLELLPMSDWYNRIYSHSTNSSVIIADELCHCVKYNRLYLYNITTGISDILKRGNYLQNFLIGLFLIKNSIRNTIINVLFLINTGYCYW